MIRVANIVLKSLYCLNLEHSRYLLKIKKQTVALSGEKKWWAEISLAMQNKYIKCVKGWWDHT